MKPKSAKGEATKAKIIRTAADLFHKQGMRATSPDEIIEATDTGKGQFYHYFKSKEGLVHAVLQNYLAAIKSGTAPVNHDVSSWQELEAWFISQIELQKSYGMKRGCPFGTIGNEVTENDELIRQDVNLIFEVMKGELTTFFVREKAKSRLSKDAKEAELADFCIAAVQGAMLMGKIRRSSESAEGAVREALAHLKRYRASPA
jgi:AcrR family transcriptional regulator